MSQLRGPSVFFSEIGDLDHLDPAAEGGRVPIRPPYDSKADTETILRQILTWIESAPAYGQSAAAQLPFRQIDKKLFSLLGDPRKDSFGDPVLHGAPAYSSSREAVKRLIEARFPGFWQTSGLCGLSGHASMGPDFRGPNGEKNRETWGDMFENMAFDADLAPGDGPHREALAMLSCVVKAEIVRLTYERDHQPDAPRP